MILIVGCGSMAEEYVKVLQAMNESFKIIGRGKESAENFFNKMHVPVVQGGLENFLGNENNNSFSSAIVATGVEQLSQITKQLIGHGIKKILVEKPAGINTKEVKIIKKLSDLKECQIYVAYNRRYLVSVEKAKEIIIEDGGVKNFNFEITEWGHTIEKLKKADGVKENWFFGNTTHVVDLAFYLGGRPKEIKCFTTGGSDWHARSYIFSGAGVTSNDVLFSYNGNWGGPGRWLVEMITSKHRLILSPLETLRIQKIGSVNIETVTLNNRLDIEFKPGLYKQVKSFISNDSKSLCSIESHLESSRYYDKIAGY